MDEVVARALRTATEIVPEVARLRGKRVLLTGGTGFLGTWLLEHLAYLNETDDLECTVLVPTRAPDAFARKLPRLATRPRFTFLPGDVRSFTPPSERCDFVIHAAASASPLTKEASPLDVGDTIVDGTRRMLELARAWEVEGMLFFSSGAVYGTQPRTLERIPEDYRGGPSIADPTATYGEGKRYAEVLCGVFARAYGVPVKIARPFAFLAPYLDLDAGYASSDFLRAALRGERLEIKSDGTTTRSYAGAGALLSMLWGILFRGAPGRAYNVGSDAPVTVLELARQIVAATGMDLPVMVALDPVPGALPARYVPDMTRMRTELGLAAQEDLGQLVSETFAWMRHHVAGASVRVAHS